MLERIREASPCFKARVAGVFYLLSVLTAVFAEAFVRGRLLFAVSLIPVLCFIAVTLLLYGIFRTVDKSVSLLAASSNLAGLAFEALELHLRGLNVAMMFHGFYCLLIGYLVFRSSFVPRILGVLMAVAGLGWLTSLSPPFAHYFHTYGQTLGFLGEGSLMLWLLVMGVDLHVVPSEA
jgi:Domain of unknown function (DUF4386)